MKKLLIVLFLTPLILLSQSWEIGTGYNAGNNNFDDAFQTFFIEKTSYSKSDNIYSFGIEIGIPLVPLTDASFGVFELTDIPGEKDDYGNLKELITGVKSYSPKVLAVKYRRYFKNQLSYSFSLGLNYADEILQYVGYELNNQIKVLDQLYDDPNLGFIDLSRNEQDELLDQYYEYDESLGQARSGISKAFLYYKIGLEYNLKSPISIKLGYGSNGLFTGMSYVFNNYDLIKNLNQRNKRSQSSKIKIADKKLSNVNVFDIREMIKIFILDCRVNGINIMTNDNIKATFEELPEGIVALAAGFNNDNEISIRVDPLKWKDASSAKKWYVLYHELGHDVLNLDHGEGGKMMFNYVDRDYTWDEWLEDKKYMLDSYKRNN
jgi:hypothetical protein